MMISGGPTKEGSRSLRIFGPFENLPFFHTGGGVIGPGASNARHYRAWQRRASLTRAGHHLELAHGRNRRQTPALAVVIAAVRG